MAMMDKAKAQAALEAYNADLERRGTNSFDEEYNEKTEALMRMGVKVSDDDKKAAEARTR